eukprot:4302881-Pyramimonas_sp.AAC.1
MRGALGHAHALHLQRQRLRAQPVRRDWGAEGLLRRDGPRPPRPCEGPRPCAPPAALEGGHIMGLPTAHVVDAHPAAQDSSATEGTRLDLRRG